MTQSNIVDKSGVVAAGAGLIVSDVDAGNSLTGEAAEARRFHELTDSKRYHLRPHNNRFRTTASSSGTVTLTVTQ